MNNKLSELSKPAWIVGEKEIADFMRGDEALLVREHDPESTEPALRMYSQEYVSALLAELEAKDKRIAELESGNALMTNQRDLWCGKVRDLEGKLATPVRLQSPWVDKVGNRWLIEGTTADVIRAAGFKCVGG